MPNRTHSKKQPPKVIIFEGCCAGTTDKPVCINDVPLKKTGVSRLIKTISTNRNPYFIGRAYSEPTGHDMVENMLLQRDYIID